MTHQSTKHNIYTRVTTRILAELEKGVRPWITPWSVEHAAGRIPRPLRHNGIPYRGVNVLLLWGEALEKGYAAPLWMTYKQSQELGAQVRKGSMVLSSSLPIVSPRPKPTTRASPWNTPFRS